MARHKRQKKRQAAGPIAKPDQKHESLRQEKILPVIALLKSAKSSDRIIAITSVNGLAEDPVMRHLLLNEHVVQVILANTLSDASQEIVAEGFGVLRNLVLEEGTKLSNTLLSKNILAPIKSGLTKLNRVLPSLTSLDGSQKQMACDLGQNLLALASVLACSSPSQIEKITCTLGEPSIRLACDAAMSSSSSLALAALDFLYTLSDDPDVSLLLKPWVVSMPEICQLNSGNLLAAAYFQGILAKCRFTLDEHSDQTILPILNNFVQIFLAATANEVESGEEDERLQLQEIVLDNFAALAEASASCNAKHSLAYIQDKVAPLVVSVLNSKDLRSRALAVLNNVGWALAADNRDWHDLASHIWMASVECLRDTNIDANDETTVSVMGILASVAKCYAAELPLYQVSELFARLMPECSQLLQSGNGLDEAQQGFIQNSVTFFSSFCLISDDGEKSDALAGLLRCSLENCSTLSPRSCVEILDTVFDIYGSSDSPRWCELWKKYEMANLLASVHPQLESRFSEISEDLQLTRDAELSLSNLEQFLIYKNEENST